MNTNLKLREGSSRQDRCFRVERVYFIRNYKTYPETLQYIHKNIKFHRLHKTTQINLTSNNNYFNLVKLVFKTKHRWRVQS